MPNYRATRPGDAFPFVGDPHTGPILAPRAKGSMAGAPRWGFRDWDEHYSSASARILHSHGPRYKPSRGPGTTFLRFPQVSSRSSCHLHQPTLIIGPTQHGRESLAEGRIHWRQIPLGRGPPAIASYRGFGTEASLRTVFSDNIRLAAARRASCALTFRNCSQPDTAARQTVLRCCK